MNTNQMRGFTLIELVVVIVILAILAAVALPRFMNATERAHDSNVIATKGALAEGVALFRSQWFVNGNSEGDAENDVNGFGDGTVDSNENGWPVATCFVEVPNNQAVEWGSAPNPVYRTPGLTMASAPSGAANCPATNPQDSFCKQIWIGLLGTQGPQVEDATGADRFVPFGVGSLGSPPEDGTPANTSQGDVYMVGYTAGADGQQTKCVYEYLPDPESTQTPGNEPRTITYDTSNGQVETNVRRFSEEGT